MSPSKAEACADEVQSVNCMR